MVCSTAWWYGSQNPDRYIIFFTPALTYLAVEGWRSFRFGAWTWALAIAGWAGALLLQVLPWFSYSKKDGAAWPLKIVSRALHHDVSVLFPSYQVMNTAAYVWGVALAIVLLGLIYKAYQAPPEP
jgi:isoprenylcysteine carboxyl methyltransferase (ICMT) family protein YpbQ